MFDDNDLIAAADATAERLAARFGLPKPRPLMQLRPMIAVNAGKFAACALPPIANRYAELGATAIAVLPGEDAIELMARNDPVMKSSPLWNVRSTGSVVGLAAIIETIAPGRGLCLLFSKHPNPADDAPSVSPAELNESEPVGAAMVAGDMSTIRWRKKPD